MYSGERNACVGYFLVNNRMRINQTAYSKFENVGYVGYLLHCKYFAVLSIGLSVCQTYGYTG